MKIKVNNVKKIAAMGLVLLEVSTFAGCRTTLNEAITYNDENKDTEIIEFISSKDLKKDLFFYEALDENGKKVAPSINDKPIIDAEVAIESTSLDEKSELSSQSLFEIYDNKHICFDNLDLEIRNYYEEHMKEINDVLNEDYHDIHVRYGSLIYQRLVNHGIPKEIILKELFNVIVEQQLPRCVSTEEWSENFGNIVSVLNGTESMYDAYFCLAYLVHDEMCDLEHHKNIYGAVTCDALENAFQKKYQLIVANNSEY